MKQKDIDIRERSWLLLLLTKEGEELREAILPILRWAISKKGTVVAHCSCSMIEKGKRFSSK
jgi:hypothetical protein